MRYLYISFFLCLIAGNSFSQTSVDSVATKGNPGPARFFIRCQATVKDDGPLWISDGVVVGLSFVKKIDPADIESIDILKDSYAVATCGGRAANGVVIITTKADKILSTMYKNTPSNKINQLLLAREVKEISPVKIISYGYGYRCGTVGVNITALSDAKDSVSSGNLSARFYPNPLMRGGSIRAEINIQEEKTLRLRTINLNGAELRSVVYRSFKGLNRIEIPTESQWAAGIYFIQVLDEKGKLLKQDKFLIQ